MLNRTEGAIQRRITDLKLLERPLRADNHTKWTNKQLSDLGKCINDCLSYTQMSDIIGKSAKAIRGKVYSMYGTEVLDKVRAIKKQPATSANVTSRVANKSTDSISLSERKVNG